MADDSVSKKTKNALKSLLSALTYNSETAFTAVAGTNAGEFDSYPAVRILPGFYDTTKASTQQNDRSVNFIVRVHLPMQPNLESEATYDHMYDLTELIVNALDVGDVHGALTQYDASLPTWILNATRGNWTVEDSDVGVVLCADVNVEISYTRDL